MKTKHWLLAALSIITLNLKAQILKGFVAEAGSGNRLSNVFIKDINGKNLDLTDKKGNFSIKTETGHTLIFSSPGYVSDTLYLSNMELKRVELNVQNATLREVNISAARRIFNPRVEYADVYRKARVYPLSPTNLFSRENRNARRLKRYFAREQQERKIDEVFSRTYVSSLVPLRGRDLEDFMTLYRPGYGFVISNGGTSLVTYVNNSYKKFMALPPEKRTLPKLEAKD